jgi:hypothetical protein
MKGTKTKMDGYENPRVMHTSIKRAKIRAPLINSKRPTLVKDLQDAITQSLDKDDYIY